MRRPQRALHKLNATKVASLLKARGQHCDGGGLWLMVATPDSASYVFRYAIASRARAMGLGSARAQTLAQAREKAAEARTLLDACRDPLEERAKMARAEALAAVPALTFKDAAKRYIAAQEPSWKNPKHKAQWPATLETYAYPRIGDLDVGAVETSHVYDILEPIWNVKQETASRLRGRIEAVLDWATALKYRQGENPARWRGHLSHLLARRTKLSRGHFAAMPIDETPAYVAALRENGCASAQALEFTILTAVRSAETIFAHSREFDLASALWTVPADRMKIPRPHRVALSARAVELVRGNWPDNDDGFIFRNAVVDDGRPLSGAAMFQLLKGSHPHLTVHGFRSTFKDWATERTNFPSLLAEIALAHKAGDDVDVAYRRGDVLEKRRKLMEAWSGFCSRPIPDSTIIRFAGAGDSRKFGPT